MFLYEMMAKVLKGEQVNSSIMADWIEDNRQDYPNKKEMELYLKRLRDPSTLRLSTLLEAVATFGSRLERRKVKRFTTKTLRSFHPKSLISMPALRYVVRKKHGLSQASTIVQRLNTNIDLG